MRERAAGIRILLAGLTPELYSTLRSVAHQLEDIQWVARVQNLGEALDVCRVGTIDVLLVEVPLHEDDHRNFARVVSGLSHRPTIVALSRVRNEESLYEAVSIGAAAVSTFDTSPEFIVSTIRRVFNGERPIEYTMVTNADLARQALRYIRELGPTSDGETLHTPCPLTLRWTPLLRQHEG